MRVLREWGLMTLVLAFLSSGLRKDASKFISEFFTLGVSFAYFLFRRDCITKKMPSNWFKIIARYYRSLRTLLEVEAQGLKEVYSAWISDIARDPALNPWSLGSEEIRGSVDILLSAYPDRDALTRDTEQIIHEASPMIDSSSKEYLSGFVMYAFENLTGTGDAGPAPLYDFVLKKDFGLITKPSLIGWVFGVGFLQVQERLTCYWAQRLHARDIVK
jgi:hypothetical protein